MCVHIIVMLIENWYAVSKILENIRVYQKNQDFLFDVNTQ